MQPNVWDDDRITAYVMGELSATESSQLESDMLTSPAIAKAVDEAREVTKQLSTMFANEPPMALDTHKRDALLAEPVTLTPKAGTTTRFSKTTLVLAASMLLAVTAGALLIPAVSKNRKVARLNSLRVETLSSELESLRRQSSVNQPANEADKFERAYEPAASMVQGSEKLKTDGSAINTPATSLPNLTLHLAEEKEVDQPDSKLDVAVPSPFSAEPGQLSKPFDINASAMVDDYDVPTEIKNGQMGGIAAMGGSSMGGTSSMSGNSAMMGSEAFASPGMGESARGVNTDASHFQSEFGTEIRPPSSASSPSTSSFKSAEMLGRRAKVNDESLAYRGRGPGEGGDQFDSIIENDFRRVSEAPLSTFSIDVDTASYSKVRQFLMQAGSLPPAGAVRIEELVNYFDYDYAPPAADSEHPFATRAEIAACPWAPEHRLVRIGIKGKVIDRDKRPASNLVFLVDTSGSMGEPNKLPIVQAGLRKLIERLGENDRVAIVVYAGSAGLVLESTSANDRSTILRKINQMQSGGSTNGGEGITLAYQTARDHFIKDGVNRVLLCSDGDFNVGVTSDDQLVDVVEKESKGGIDITVLGFGMGNHNDSMMEQISGRGNGNYAFIDSEAEADRVLVDQLSGTLVTIARDVKIQVEFNPAEVAAYRLIGYENRKLANEDFKDDTKDAGEIGAGHSVTALYELIPAKGDTATLAPEVDELRYQKPVNATEASDSGEMMTVKLRYKKPEGGKSIPVEFPVTDANALFENATTDFRFAASVAGFGMLLRSSEHAGSWTLGDVIKVAENATGDDAHGLRNEFVMMVRKALSLRTGE